MFVLLHQIRDLIILILLIVASIQDIKTREIDDRIWMIAAIVTVPVLVLDFISSPYLTKVIAVIFGLLLSLAIYLAQIMGGADAKALAILALVLPENIPKTTEISYILLTCLEATPVVVLINAVLVTAITLIPYVVLRNIVWIFKRRRAFAPNADAFTKAMLFLTSYYVPVSKYLSEHFKYFLIELPTKEKKRYLLSIKIEDQDKIAEEVKQALERGLLGRDDEVLVMYGVPMIVYITIGYVLYRFLGIHIAFSILNFLSEIL